MFFKQTALRGIFPQVHIKVSPKVKVRQTIVDLDLMQDFSLASQLCTSTLKYDKEEKVKMVFSSPFASS